jgi:hypothetical protein
MEQIVECAAITERVTLHEPQRKRHLDAVTRIVANA